MKTFITQKVAETQAATDTSSLSIREQLQPQRDKEADQATCDRLIESLRYDDMNLRCNEIVLGTVKLLNTSSAETQRASMLLCRNG